MADKAIHDLPTLSSLTSGTFIELDKFVSGNYTSYKCTLATLGAFLGASWYSLVSDENAVVMPQRAQLGFNGGFHVTDDSTDGITNVSIDTAWFSQNFVPLGGTVNLYPLSGTIEVSNINYAPLSQVNDGIASFAIGKGDQKDLAGNVFGGIYFIEASGKNAIQLEAYDVTNALSRKELTFMLDLSTESIVAGTSITLFNNTTTFRGIQYNQEYYTNFTDLSLVNQSYVIPRRGTNVGQPLIGPIEFATADVAIWQNSGTGTGYYIGFAASETDFQNGIGQLSGTFYGPNNVYHFVQASDQISGSNVNLTDTYAQIQGISATGTNSSLSVSYSGLQIVSNHSAFTGINYAGFAAGYVLSNQTGNTLLHRSAGDARWEQLTNKGIAGGYASLDGGGKVPASQLPNTVMELQGDWNASTNTPTLADGIGNPGDIYEVTTAGTVNLGSGAITFAVGDWVVYGASGAWHKSLNSNAVTSVNGFTGTVVLSTTNISEGSNLYFTNARVDSRVQSYTGDVTLSGTAFSIGANKVTDGMLTLSYLKADGSRPLTADWALGGYSLTGVKSLSISGTAGNGFISLISQSSAPAAPASGTIIFSDSNNKLSWKGASNNFKKTFDAGGATQDILMSIPNIAAFTIASIDGGQTFTSATWNGTKISEVYGGTNQNSYAAGDTLYASGTNTLAKLAGDNSGLKKVLSMTSNVPSWSLPTTITLTSVTQATCSSTNVDEIGASIKIPAGTATTNDLIRVFAQFSDTSNTNNKIWKFWINSTNSLTGATQIAGTLTDNTTGAASRSIGRLYAIRSNTSVITNGTGAAPTQISNEYSTSTTVPAAITIPTLASDVYIIVSMQRASAGDTVATEFAYVQVYKAS